MPILPVSGSRPLWGASPPPPASPWRVVYVEGGSFRDYCQNLIELARGLHRLGLISNRPPEVDGNSEDAGPIWQWLSANAGGHHLTFLANGFYSADWDPDRLQEMKADILKRLERGEIDLILTFGTAAGLALVTNEHSTPVLSITATSPVVAGFSQTDEDSGLDHAHIQVQVGTIERQLLMFHNIFHFQTLGVPFDSTPEGQKSMARGTIERMAEAVGFKIITCETDLEFEPDDQKRLNNLAGCVEKLAAESDAIYLTANNGMQKAGMDRILAPVIARRRPTFAQEASQTAHGALMSLAEANFSVSGQWEAEVVQKVLAGVKPRSINQLYLAPMNFSLNLAMARDIGWTPPFDLLVAADHIYQNLLDNE